MIHPASAEPLQVKDMRQSVLDLFRSKNSSPLSSQLTQHIMHRPIPAPEPNPEPNPGPDGVTQASHIISNHIAAADWDELFHAVQARLEHCVEEAVFRTARLTLDDRYAVTKSAVMECVRDMMSLQASLTVERLKWQEQQNNQGQQQHQDLEKQQQSSPKVQH